MCHMIPILDRRHVLSLRKYPDEIGFVVESAIITDLGGAERRIDEQFTRPCYTKVVYIRDEGYACLLLEEMTECGA